MWIGPLRLRSKINHELCPDNVIGLNDYCSSILSKISVFRFQKIHANQQSK